LNSSLVLKELTIELSSKTIIMGIVNVTPDSFSDGGMYTQGGPPETARAVDAALTMVDEGADIIDVGGESTRPGSARVSAEEELDRVIPVIEGIRRHSSIPVSIDTYKSVVAVAAAKAGASMINDISACRMDPEMAVTAAATGCALVLMHMKGRPEDMQKDPAYVDVVSEVSGFLLERATAAEAAGVSKERILIDPGIGFGKTVGHNLTLINRLDILAALGYPVVLGVSRKAFIGSITGGAGPMDRLEGTLAACVAGIMRGASILRVHDVSAVTKAAAVADAVARA